MVRYELMYSSLEEAYNSKVARYQDLAPQIKDLTGAISIVFHGLPISAHGNWFPINMEVLADLDIKSKYFEECLYQRTILYTLDVSWKANNKAYLTW